MLLSAAFACTFAAHILPRSLFEPFDFLLIFF